MSSTGTAGLKRARTSKFYGIALAGIVAAGLMRRRYVEDTAPPVIST